MTGVQTCALPIYSVDAANGLRIMPYERQAGGWTPGKSDNSYGEQVLQLHRALYNANVGADFVFANSADPKQDLARELAQYKLVLIPSLYIATDAQLQAISDYVKNGGHVLMNFKSGFANENSAVRAQRAPGPLRAAAGFNYQEFSSLEKPLALKGDPYKLGADNQVATWAEFLQLEHAEALAYYDHPFFGQWPAITRNHYGTGELVYEGTHPSDALQSKIVLDCLKSAGLTSADQQLPTAVRVKHGVNRAGKQLHYYLNYSSSSQTLTYTYAAGKDLLTDGAVAPNQSIVLGPWDVAIVEEK